MSIHNKDLRNFLFFLNDITPLNVGGSLISGLGEDSNWESVRTMVQKDRKKDPFVRSIKKAQIYIHVPFCGRICTFCHCSKVLLRRRSEVDAYVSELGRQMKFIAPAFKGMDTETLCFGGGTPSILDEQQMTAVLDDIDHHFPAKARKIHFEINPSSWNASKLSILSERGLYRISIGVQSLDRKVLKTVSRAQTADKVLWCLRSAKKARVPYVNVDFMAGLPGQTVEGLINDLKIAIHEGANVVHVEPYGSSSLAGLCGPGETFPEFHKRRDAMMKASIQLLLKEGFRRKGLQGTFIRDGKGEYEGEYHSEEAYMLLEAAVLGLGPFARGQFPGVCYYRSGDFKSSTEFPKIEIFPQNPRFVMSQYVVLALLDGLDEKVFRKRFGVSLDRQLKAGLRDLQKSGFVSFSAGVWKFSGKPDVSRIFEYTALSRILLGESLLEKLRSKYEAKYDPKIDYSKGASFSRAYANNALMMLHYTVGV